MTTRKPPAPAKPKPKVETPEEKRDRLLGEITKIEAKELPTIDDLRDSLEETSFPEDVMDAYLERTRAHMDLNRALEVKKRYQDIANTADATFWMAFNAHTGISDKPSANGDIPGQMKLGEPALPEPGGCPEHLAATLIEAVAYLTSSQRAKLKAAGIATVGETIERVHSDPKWTDNVKGIKAAEGRKIEANVARWIKENESIRSKERR